MVTKNKRGELLVQNIVFIVLNVMFLTIMVLFLLKQGSGGVFLEQSYSKQIALMIDSAKPGSVIQFNMEKGMKVAKERGIDAEKIVTINGNFVKVQLSEKGGREYSFFNDVEVHIYPSTDVLSNSYNGLYTITISKKLVKTNGN